MINKFNLKKENIVILQFNFDDFHEKQNFTSELLKDSSPKLKLFCNNI